MPYDNDNDDDGDNNNEHSAETRKHEARKHQLLKSPITTIYTVVSL